MYSLQTLLALSAIVITTLGQDVRNCKYVTIPVCDDEDLTTTLTQRHGGLRARGPPGAPGKRGAEGLIGPKGNKGEAGSPAKDGENASPEDIEEMIDRKINEKYSEMLTMTGSEFCLTAESGIYMVNGDVISCDGQGWTVIQKRRDGSVDFERSWMEYSLGFGNLEGEFWLGLKPLYKIMHGRQCKLRVELESFNQENAHAEYSSFSIGHGGQKYRLSISGYSGTAGDSMALSNGMMFSTKDNDNDSAGHTCAVGYGGWWFENCFHASLNAPWGRSTGRWKNIVWNAWKGPSEALKTSTMKIRCG